MRCVVIIMGWNGGTDREVMMGKCNLISKHNDTPV